MLQLCESGQLSLDNLLRSEVFVVTFQILLRILNDETKEDSWIGHSNTLEGAEILSFLGPLSLPLSSIRDKVESAIFSGSKPNRNVPRNTLWKLSNVPYEKIEKLAKFYQAMPIFNKVDPWKIQAWLVEGYLFKSELLCRCPEIFARKATTDLYLDYIPFSLTAANGLGNFGLSAQILLDLMTVSVVIFHTDEFFDGIVKDHDLSDLRTVLSLPGNCRDILVRLQACDRPVHQQLSTLLQFVLEFPRIQDAGKNEKAQLDTELKAYLLASVHQCEDNDRFRKQFSTDVYLSPASSYIKWVRTTAVEHGSWQYAFAFLMCLQSRHSHFELDVETRYIVQDCVSRLSTLARMHNDYGSITRDRKEANLNSIFFPEFFGDSKSDQKLREELDRVARYESRCFISAFKELGRVCGRQSPVFRIVDFFRRITEIYNNVYRMRDLSNWL